MKRSNLLGLAFAATCFAAAAPAYADAKLEYARQAYSGDVTTAYKDAVKCFETGASCDGVAALKKLRETTSKLNDYSNQIRSDLKSINYTFQAWETAGNEVYNFHADVDNMYQKASNKLQVNIGELRSRYENAGSALERGHNALREFGKRIVEIRSSVVSMKDKYKGSITSYYREAYKYLDVDDIIKLNKVGAMDSIKMLANEISDWYKLQGAGDMLVQNINTPEQLKGIRNLQANMISFRSATMDISTKSNDSSLSLDVVKRNLDIMRNSYERLGSDIENAESAARTYQERLLTICDSCR